MCWRVKRWKLEFSVTAEQNRWVGVQIPGSNPPDFEWQLQGYISHQASYSGDLLIAGRNQSGQFEYQARSAHSGKERAGQSPRPIDTIEREADLICAGDNSYAMAAQFISTATFSGGIGGSAVLEKSNTYNVGLTQIPRSGLRAVLSHSLPNAFLLGSSPLLDPANTIPVFSGYTEGQIKWRGASFPLQFKMFDFGSDITQPPPLPAGGFASTYFKTLSFNFVLEPSAYWPYDPNDSLGPIYDEATGERLRPNP